MSSDGEKDKTSEDMGKNKKNDDPLATNDEKKETEDDKNLNSSTEEKTEDDKKDVKKDDKKDVKKDDKKDDNSTEDKKAEQSTDDEPDTKKSDAKSQDKTTNKEKNGTTNDKKKETVTKPTDKEKEKEEEIMSLGEIAKINENITKTKVEGLQTLHSICYDTAGKSTVIKRNLRKFDGFAYTVDSDAYKKKLESIEKIDIKLLKAVCDIIDLDKKGTKEDISERIIEFLNTPNGEPEQEDEEEDAEEEEHIEEPSSEEEDKRKRKRSNANVDKTAKNTTGRPRRATAGKSNKDLSAYVEYSSSDESTGRKYAPVKRRRRKDDSDSGSDVTFNLKEAHSDGGRKRQSARGAVGRGRPATRRGRRKNSDSEEEESPSFDDDSDEPKKKRGNTGRPKGRPPAASGPGRKRGRRKNESESEEEEDESEVESAESEDDSKKKKANKTSVKDKVNNKAKSSTPANAGTTRPKKPLKSKKDESSGEENDADEKDAESEDEPLAKKTKPTPPTDEEIKGYVKEILDEANLEEITMKTVCKQVYAKYPQFDLTDKKDFIKATVKSLIAA